MMISRRSSREAGDSDALVERASAAARPLSGADDLDPLMDVIGDARFILLGEATHGTSEFYTWRAELSKRLISERGFSFVAVEGDWPDCYEVNRFVRPACEEPSHPYPCTLR